MSTNKQFPDPAIIAFANTMHQYSAPKKGNEPVAPPAPVMSPQEKEISKLCYLVKRQLPAADESLIQDFSTFLLSPPAPISEDWQAQVDNRFQATQQIATATDIADRLIKSGFGQMKRITLGKSALQKYREAGLAIEAPDKPLNERVSGLATILMNVPKANENKATRTFLDEFSVWKDNFVAELQGRQSLDVGMRR